MEAYIYSKILFGNYLGRICAYKSDLKNYELALLFTNESNLMYTLQRHENTWD